MMNSENVPVFDAGRIRMVKRRGARWALAVMLPVICHVCLGASVAHSQESEESETKQAAGLFLGATTKFRDAKPDETGFTIAGEYEYRGSGWGKWGVAGVVEFIFMDEIEAIVMPLVYFHFTPEFFVRGGGGLEIGQAEDEAEKEAHFIVRLGAGYEIPVGDFKIIPSIDFDAIRSDPATAYGIVFAKER
jgi:hypothetical protein